MSERPNAFSGTNPALVVAADRPMLDIFVTCACYRLHPGLHNLSPGRIFGGSTDFGEFSASVRPRCSRTVDYRRPGLQVLRTSPRNCMKRGPYRAPSAHLGGVRAPRRAELCTFDAF